jgi:hypothetical protein
VEFRSRHQTLLVPLGPDHIISFANGVYRTTDPGEIRALRQVVQIESRGNRAVVEANSAVDGPKLEGIISCRFTGYAEITVYARGQLWADLAAQIAEHLTVQGLQQGHTTGPVSLEVDEGATPPEPTEALAGGERLKGKIRGRRTANMEGVVAMSPLDVAAAVAGR